MKPANLVGFVRFPGWAPDRIGEVLRSHEAIEDVTERLPVLAGNEHAPIDWASITRPPGEGSSEPPSLLLSTTTGVSDGVEHVVQALDRAVASGVRSAVILLLERQPRSAVPQADGHLSRLLYLLNRLRRYHHRICVHGDVAAFPAEEVGRLLGLFPYHLSSLPPAVWQGSAKPSPAIDDAAHPAASTADGALQRLLEALDARCLGDFSFADEAYVAEELILMLRQAGVR